MTVAAAVLLVASSPAFLRGQGTGPTQPVQIPLANSTGAGVQVQQAAQVPAGSATSVSVQVQPPYSGSVQSLGESGSPREITLDEAIGSGLRANLGVVNSSLATQYAEAQRKEARSALLPNINLNGSENAAKLNLAAQGFSASAFGDSSIQFPSTVGPFHYYDFHIGLQQHILDLTAVHNVRSDAVAVRATVLQAQEAREQVVLSVTGVYLQLMADLALTERQKSEVQLAEATYRQASVQVDAGTKAPIEANRSLVELQTEKQRLRAQGGQVQKRQIQLARLIGIPPGVEMIPREHLNPSVEALPAVADLVERAWKQRADLRAAEVQVTVAEEARKAAAAQRIPTVDLSGTYGVQGTNPNQGDTVFQATAGFNLPIYHGGRIQAQIAEADIVVRQRRADLADQRGAIEAQVRTAVIDVEVANDQVALSDRNRKLAQETLGQSQDRFSVGVADSVEVINSQQALAGADHDYVSSLFAQRVARVTLAQAMGEVEKDVSVMFKGKM